MAKTNDDDEVDEGQTRVPKGPPPPYIIRFNSAIGLTHTFGSGRSWLCLCNDALIPPPPLPPPASPRKYDDDDDDDVTGRRGHGEDDDAI